MRLYLIFNIKRRKYLKLITLNIPSLSCPKSDRFKTSFSTRGSWESQRSMLYWDKVFLIKKFGCVTVTSRPPILYPSRVECFTNCQSQTPWHWVGDGGRFTVTCGTVSVLCQGLSYRYNYKQIISIWIITLRFNYKGWRLASFKLWLT